MQSPNSVLAYASILYGARRLLVAGTCVGVAVALAYAVLRPQSYIVSGAIAPQVPSSSMQGLGSLVPRQLASLASLPGSPGVHFYARLLTSRDLLGDMVLREYESSAGRQGPLAMHLGVSTAGSDSAVIRARAVDRLRRCIHVRVEDRAGIVSFDVRMRDRSIALDVARHLVAAIQRYNMELRQSSARAERAFVEARLAEAAASLRVAEDAEVGFLRRNAEFRSSPVLQAQHSRLQREVLRLQGVVNDLSQAYERSRVEEVRDTPVVSVLEQPERTIRRANRALVRTTAAGAAAGLLGSVLVAFGMFSLASLGVRSRSDLRSILIQGPTRGGK